MNKISVYIIAFNEGEKIRDAINSVLWADEIVVADSYSQDNTAAIAEEMGARVVQIPFCGFGDLRNRAMEACTYEWIFSLDSDERCTPEVRDEIFQALEAPQADAYYVPRRNYFMGRWIKHSGFYPDYRQPQLFRKGSLVFKENDPVHEEFSVISQKPVAYFKTGHLAVSIQRHARTAAQGQQIFNPRCRQTGPGRAAFLLIVDGSGPWRLVVFPYVHPQARPA